MTDIQPATYYRQSQDWQHWLNKTGRVVVATTVRVAAPEFQELTPYSFVLVEFSDKSTGKTRHGFIGATNCEFKSGSRVKCVFRRLGTVSCQGLISYGIKVVPIGKDEKS